MYSCAAAVLLVRCCTDVMFYCAVCATRKYRSTGVQYRWTVGGAFL